MKIGVKKLVEWATMPCYAHEGDAGLDIFSAEDKVIESGCFALVASGIALDLPAGVEVQVRPRSGLALKHGITVLNSPGTVDCGYRGEVGVILINHGKQSFEVKKGMRIAQMVVCKYETAQLVEIQELSHTQRNQGGFGSSGI